MLYKRQLFYICLFFLVFISMGIYTTYHSMQKTTMRDVGKLVSVAGDGEYLKFNFLGLEYSLAKNNLTYSSLRKRSADLTALVARETGSFYRKAQAAGRKGWIMLQEKLEEIRSKSSGDNI